MGSITPLTLAMMSLSNEGALFTETQQKLFAKSVVDYFANISGFHNNISAKDSIDQSPAYTVGDFIEFTDDYLYKYISEESATYCKKGSFQVGTTKYFQTMENEKARDELEGLAFIDTQMRNRVANTAVLMGSNYYIFCGTDAISNYHVENFGPILIRIKIKSFASKLAKRLGALSYKIMKVNYANAKLIRTELPLQIDPDSFSNLGSSDMQLYMRHLISECTLPCLLTKPSWFENESEIRITFEMPFDVGSQQPKRFEHKGLLKYIEFLK